MSAFVNELRKRTISLVVMALLLLEIVLPLNVAFAADEILVEVTNNTYDAEIYAFSTTYPNPPEYIQSVQYRLQGATEWIELEADGASYPVESEVYAYIYPWHVRSGTHNYEIRVLDESLNEYPSGGYSVQSLTNDDTISGNINNHTIDEIVYVDFASIEEFLTVEGIEYKIDDGSWTQMADDPFGGPCTSPEFGTFCAESQLAYSVVPSGTHTVYFRAYDAWGDYWPDANGYNTSVDGTGVSEGGSEVGSDASMPAPVYFLDSSYNLTDNADGNNEVYLKAYIDVPDSYNVETFDVGDGTDTFLTYYGTDSTYTSEVSNNDVSGVSGVDARINFSASAGETHYFKVYNTIPAPTSNFGVRMNAASGDVSDYYVRSNVITPNNGSSFNLPIESSGTNRLLALQMSYRNPGGKTVNQVAYNTSELFTVGCISNRNEYTSGTWYLSNPTVGTHNISIDFTGGVEDVIAGVVLYEDMNTAEPLGVSACNDGYSVNPSGTIVSDSDQVVFGGSLVYTGSDASVTIDESGADPVWNSVSDPGIGVPNAIGFAGTRLGEVSTTMSWTSTVSWPWGVSLMSFNTSSAGSDNTDPEINITEPTGIIGHAFSISGNATEDASNITSITATVTPDTYTSISVVDDGNGLNSQSEDFTLTGTIKDSGLYEINVVVVNEAGRQSNYSFDVNVDSSNPTFSLTNLGSDPIDDNTPTYTGTAYANAQGATVSSVEYYVTSGLFGTNGTRDWASVDADDAFDAAVEGFSFTIDNPVLVEGVHEISIRVVDSLGNISTNDQINNPSSGLVADRIVVDKFDESPPIIQLQQIIPQVTTDTTPVLQGKVKDDTSEKYSTVGSISYNLDGKGWVEVSPIDGVYDEIIESFSVELEELEVGQHTIVVRARDSVVPEANETSTGNGDKTVSFEVVSPVGYNSTRLSKSEEFKNSDDRDFIGTENVIWGNDRLRLAEEFAPVDTLITSTNDLTDRYLYTANDMPLEVSASGGYWFGKGRDKFVYIDSGNNETTYDLTSFGVGDNPVLDIKEVVSGGNYITWVAFNSGVLGINWGTSVTDGTWDSFDVQLSPNTGTSRIVLDERVGDYSLFYNYTGGIVYYTPSSDTETIYVANATYEIDNVVSLYFDAVNSTLWLGDYDDGITALNVGSNPHSALATFSQSKYAVNGVFGFDKDQYGNMVFAGDDGLQVLLNDTPTDILSNDDLGETVAGMMDYYEGDNIVPDQFFVGTRAGYLVYYTTNGTYDDAFDDQLIRIPFVEDRYPAAVNDMILLDDDTLAVSSKSEGGYIIDLNRSFVSSGVAMTEIDSRIEGRLVVDYIKLNYVDVLINSGGISYEVSNDGGLSWYPITVGNTIDFSQDDYRIKFKISLTEGSTPVIDDFSLSYSAYVDDNRYLNLEVKDTPATVYTGESFNFTVSALDQVGNPFDEDTDNITIELRDVLTNSAQQSFTVKSADIDAFVGDLALNGRAEVLGLHYIAASHPDAATTAISPLINFINKGAGGGGEDGQSPALTFISDKYQIKSGESVNLSWNSSLLDTLNLKSEFEEYGEVEYAGNKNVTLSEDTLFTLTGTGEYGSLERTVFIEVTQEEVITEEPSRAEDVDYISIDQSEERENGLIAILGILSGIIGLGLLTSLLNLTTISTAGNLLDGLLKLIGFLIGIVIGRKRKYWGIVFDVQGSKPVPFAVVHLYKKGELVDQTVTDIDGRYGLLLEESGEYLLKVASNGFQNYDKTVKADKVGANIEVVEDVPLERLDRKYNWFYKALYYSKRELFVVVKFVIFVLMIIGFVYTVYATSVSPILINYLFLAIYFVLFVLNLISFLQYDRKTAGRVVDKQGKPIEGVSVRIYDQVEQRGVYLTNDKGQVKIRLNSGKYWIIVYKKGYKSISKNVAKLGREEAKFDEIVIDAAGFFEADIVMEKQESGNKTTMADTKELIQVNNPFA